MGCPIDIAKIPKRIYLGLVAVFILIAFVCIFFERYHAELSIETKRRDNITQLMQSYPNRFTMRALTFEDDTYKASLDIHLFWFEQHSFAKIMQSLALQPEWKKGPFDCPYFSFAVFGALSTLVMLLLTYVFMLVHSETLKTLDLIGAQRPYVFRLFRWQFFKTYFISIVVGLCFVTGYFALLYPDVIYHIPLSLFIVPPFFVLWLTCLSSLVVWGKIYGRSS